MEKELNITEMYMPTSREYIPAQVIEIRSEHEMNYQILWLNFLIMNMEMTPKCKNIAKWIINHLDDFVLNKSQREIAKEMNVPLISVEITMKRLREYNFLIKTAYKKYHINPLLIPDKVQFKSKNPKCFCVCYKYVYEEKEGK